MPKLDVSRKINNFCFANDITFIATNEDAIADVFPRVNSGSLTYEVEINMRKAKFMINNRKSQTQIIRKLEEFHDFN